ncbi:M48 family metallopeptidase [Ideonella sp.]|jgi:Zn-dependent protease with chaperone function|uniref:M48 family metallopeptidase n=1 Tax=Ideonella sp. TaxID=1929293 RepID=UPI0037BEE3CD
MPLLNTTYYDGRSPKAWPVTAELQGQALVIEGEGQQHRVPLAQVRWPERQRYGARLCYLPGGGLLCHEDGPAWDAWAQASGRKEPLVVTWMQSWRAAVLAGLACLAFIAVTWVWGIPWASKAVVAVVPASVERHLGDSALSSIESAMLKPSSLPAAEQEAIRQRFAKAVAAAYPPGEAPAYELHFRSADKAGLGPNAFALPGGHMVLTDELAELLKDQPDAITGVLAHELGHVRHRHGLRMVVQTSLLASLISVVVGDVSSLLATVPAVLTEQAYSREAERESDQESVDILRKAGISPSVMVVFFERIEAWRQKKTGDSGVDLPIALSSHPSDEERVNFFKNAK